MRRGTGQIEDFFEKHAAGQRLQTKLVVGIMSF
jgi:hypothetical protein